MCAHRDDRTSVPAQDLFGRREKFGGSAHFTIRGAKRLRSQTGADHQRPVVLLAMNFGSDAVDAGDEGTSGAAVDVALSWHEWETLFHEFGHALHSMLSRTSFQHLSGGAAAAAAGAHGLTAALAARTGTRTSIDFVEVPSHVVERFACEPALLRTVAGVWPAGRDASAL